MTSGVDPELFLRQILLPEIGPRGQARLAAAEAAVAGEGLAHEVAARYARAAGVGTIVAGAVDVEVLAPAAVLAHEAPRAVLAGARAALAAVREGVGLPHRDPRTEVAAP